MMKTTLCLLSTTAILFAATTASAGEKYKLFKVDVATVGVHQPGNGAWGGGGAVEPMFNVHDNVAVGARFEAFLTGGGHLGAATTSVSMGGGVAALAKSEVYLTTTAVRPFVGGGLGIYHLGGQEVGVGPASTGISQGGGSYFGVAPQIGIELGAFRIGASYNVLFVPQSQASQSVSVGPNEVSVSQSVGGGTTGDALSRNYFSLELGFRFGGGPKVETKAPAKVVGGTF